MIHHAIFHGHMLQIIRSTLAQKNMIKKDAANAVNFHSVCQATFNPLFT